MNSSDWDAKYEGADLLWGVGPNRFVHEELAGVTPGRALDLACGEGRNALWLAERGWVVDAVDFSAVAIDRAQMLAAEREVEVRFEVGDVLERTWPDDYDLVLVAYLQLPREERAVVLSVGRSAVAPAGTFLLVGHDRRNHTEGIGGPTNPSLLWTVEEVVAALDGLDIERAETVERPVDGASKPALDTLVRARRPV